MGRALHNKHAVVAPPPYLPSAQAVHVPFVPDVDAQPKPLSHARHSFAVGLGIEQPVAVFCVCVQSPAGLKYPELTATMPVPSAQFPAVHAELVAGHVAAVLPSLDHVPEPHILHAPLISLRPAEHDAHSFAVLLFV